MINYPNKKNVLQKTPIYSNRGMSLEFDINSANHYYNINNIAIIHKKPTPVKVLKIKYPENRITDAFYERPSTTDYNGIYKGKYIDFEAKETKNSTSFSLSNIHNHQLEHLIKVYKHGGISFMIIRFSHFNETFLIFIQDIIPHLNLKSLKYSLVKEIGHLIPFKLGKSLDYLAVIDNFIIL